MEEKIIDILNICGICTVGFPEKDIDIAEEIEDSLQFVSLIVEVEEELQIVLPDEFLILNNFHYIQ